jgi:mannose-6-phosphate isomerase-like protein (cupin superfamily)
MTLKSFGLIAFVASFSFAAGVGVERKSATKDLESRIYAKEDARLSSGDWGSIRLYTEDGTPTFGTSSMLTAQLEFVPGKQLHPPHQHAEEEFQYIIEGSGTWSLNGKEFPAKKGDLMYSRPWDMHGVLNSSSEPLRFFVFKWNSKGFAPAPPQAAK